MHCFCRLPVHSELAAAGKSSMFPDEGEIETIKQMVGALEIVEVGTRALCRRDVDLAKADKVNDHVHLPNESCSLIKWDRQSFGTRNHSFIDCKI